MEIPKATWQTNWPEQAEVLRSMNRTLNEGRGLSVLEMVANDLERNDPDVARINARNQSDKWDYVTDKVRKWLINNIFDNFRAPWELTPETFYERMASKRIAEIDTRYDEHSNTEEGVRQKLVEKGFHQINRVALTMNPLDRSGLFRSIDVKTADEALEQELEKAQLTSGKTMLGKAVVIVREHDQKEAFVFVRTKVKREDLVPGWNTGTTVWTESDGTIVGKAVSSYGALDEKIEVMLLKRYYPEGKLEEKLDELSAANLPIEIEESDNPDYIRFHIDLKKTHNANLAFNSLKTEFDNWFTRS
ncbi:MAG: hypothetical protein HYV90_00995 [Candidatus Woesebacteria bacterium]|nr:MAG: hypothetical protein HYV90_00995 [Candidatus Woesebacteria bacterium]